MITAFNDSGTTGEDDEPLDTSIFKCRDFAEAYRDLEVRIHLQSTEQDPNYPSRPRLNFKGEIMGVNSIMGQVLMTEEGEICWQFVSEMGLLLGHCCSYSYTIFAGNWGRQCNGMEVGILVYFLSHTY